MRNLLALVAFLCGMCKAAGQEPPVITERKDHFQSGTKMETPKVCLEIFEPKSDKKLPAILLVPESKSMEDVGPTYRVIARRTAEHGFVVGLVHFFERTGHKGVDPKAITRKDFVAWTETVKDATRHLRKQASVREDEVGLLGFSLGGFLSLAAAADEKVQVGAVACYCGGVPEELWPHIKHLPPTLMVHGRKDSVVPVSHAYSVIGFCCEHKIPHQCKVYDDGHLFEVTLKSFGFWEAIMGNLDPAKIVAKALRKDPTMIEAVGVGMAFFHTHLPKKVGKRFKKCLDYPK